MNGVNKLLICFTLATIALGTGCVPPGPLNWYYDGDSDGYGDPDIVVTAEQRPDQYVLNRRDCNDSDAAINPDATEVFDGIDNNCNDLIDEYVIGQTGPAGGIVFYVDETGFHGLEAAPVDQASNAEFGCDGIDIPGAENKEFGSGAQNTADILAANCEPETLGNSVAADVTANYSLNGFDDWYLPSIRELDALYHARYIVGGFDAWAYRSSTESTGVGGNGSAIIKAFKRSSSVFQAGRNYNVAKGASLSVRAVRSF